MSGWNQEQEYQAGIRDEQRRIINIINNHLVVPDSDCLKQANPYHCPACSVRIDILADIKRGDK